MRIASLRLLVAVSFAACAPPGGPPARPSPALVPSTLRFPDGTYLWDLRDDSPVFAVTNAEGLSEVRDLDGLVAPPVPGHEAETIVGLRGLPGGEVWVCFDDGVAGYTGGAWTYTSFATIGVPGTCSSLDARAYNDLYVGVGMHVCYYDTVLWDCYEFPAPTREVTLTDGYLWFVRQTAAHDDLMVIDTISRATPSLIRLGDPGTTGLMLPVPDADEIVVTHQAGTGGEEWARTIDFDGNIQIEDAQYVVPIGPGDRYLFRVESSMGVHCRGGIARRCGVADDWSQLVVTRSTAGAVTEVAHLTVVGPGGVPSWGLRSAGALLVEGDPLFRLP